MTSSADFHTHTNASDGVLAPRDLVGLAVSRGLRILAVTDHDSTEGIPEAMAAAAEHPGLALVPGIEMSTDIPGDEIHVLGYFLDYEDGEFQATLTRLRRARFDRGRMMVEKLQGMGMNISWERVQELADGASVGRPHVAQALIESGAVSNFQEAFDRYIGRNGPAYVERAKLTPVEAIELLVKARALPVLAHPASQSNLDALVTELKTAGMIGMEVYYQDYDASTCSRLGAIADRHGLLKLGGSDYHGFGGDRERLPGDIPLPEEAIDTFMAAAARMTAERL
jgi:predicted metal-dependent phosphoesterase TrpH